MFPASLLAPSGPGASVYSTKVEPPILGDALCGQIAAEIDNSRRRLGQAPLVRDGRLDRVAHDIARATGGRRALPPDAVAFLLWHYGIVEPEPNLFLLRGDDGAEGSALASLKAQSAGAPAAAEWRRLGIGVQREIGQWSAVVVLQDKNLDIEAVPRQWRQGGQTLVAGRIRAVFRSPEVLVTPPHGAVERPPVTRRHDGFVTRVPCNRGEGTYQIEISALDDRGPRVLANFPVYCGTEPPGTIPVAAEAAPSVRNPAEAERQLLELLDRDRKQAGLPALVRDPRLSAVARRYSREMAETGEVAHFSPRTGSVVDRVRVAGVTPPPTILAENVGSAASAADAELAFMSSPGHRDNILQPEVTHVGVGVVAGREEGGVVALYFTQIFAGWAK